MKNKTEEKEGNKVKPRGGRGSREENC